MTKTSRKSKKSNNKDPLDRCPVCNKQITGMPHYCKFCHEKHCDEHILPESHNCPGLNGRKAWVKPIGNPSSFKRKKKKSTYSGEKLYSTAKDFINFNKPKKRQKKKIQDNNDDEIISLTLGKVKKRKKELVIPWKKIIIVILLIVIATTIYYNWDKISKIINPPENPTVVIEGSKIDNLSLSAMNYLNDYRMSNGVDPIDISEELNGALISLSNEIRKDPDKYPRPVQMIDYTKSIMKLPEYKTFFVKSYAIRGGGIEKFREEFDKRFSSRNLVIDEDYNYGAIGCNLDYCVIALFEKDKSAQETEKIPEIQLSDQVISKDNPLEKCRSQVEDTAAAEVMSSNGDFIFKIEEYKTFENKNDLKNYIAKYQTANQYIGICSDDEEFISFLVVFEYQGDNPYFADKYTKVFICDEDGDNVAKSYSC